MRNDKRINLLTQDNRATSGGERELIISQMTSSGRTLRFPNASILRSTTAIFPPLFSIVSLSSNSMNKQKGIYINEFET